MLTGVTNKGRFQTLVLTWLCLTMQAVPLAGLPLLLPLIRQDLGLTYVQAGSLASANLLVYALMQIPSGYLVDRYSPRKLVATGVLGLMGLSVLLAFTRQYWQILGIQFFWGFFSSLIFTPSMSVFIRWFSPERHTTASTLPIVGTSLGILAVNLLFPAIVNRFDTWRPPFIVFGVAGIIFTLGLLLFGRDARSKEMPAKCRLDIIREVFRYKEVWICYGLQFIRFGVVQGMMFWLPTLLISEKQFSLQLAGAVIALQAIITGSSNIFIAYLSERFKKPTLVIGVSLVMLLITTALLVPVNYAGLIIAVIFINAIFLQAYFGPLFTLAVEILGPEKTGISNGVSNMFAIFGGLFSAYLMGILKDTTGSFEWGFYSICILCAAGLLLTFMLEKMRRAKAVSPSRNNH
jgi:nitrate/nitrite transporter NarK